MSKNEFVMTDHMEAINNATVTQIGHFIEYCKEVQRKKIAAEHKVTSEDTEYFKNLYEMYHEDSNIKVTIECCKWLRDRYDISFASARLIYKQWELENK